MRCIALSLLVLTGCQTMKPVVPKIVRVPVEVIVPVPAALTEPCPIYEVKAQTYEEAITAANARKAALVHCNGKLAEIRGLGK